MSIKSILGQVFMSTQHDPFIKHVEIAVFVSTQHDLFIKWLTSVVCYYQFNNQVMLGLRVLTQLINRLDLG